MHTEPVPAETDDLRGSHWDRPQLSVAATARRLGIAPATLRTWDRRYGIGPTGHTPGRHRRYSPEDVARLELMQHALVRGATAVDAARYATTARLSASVTEERRPADPHTDGTGADPAGADGARAEGDDVSDTHGPAGPPSRRGGSTRLRMTGAGPRAQGLARAALSLDSAAVRELITDSVRVTGVESTWEAVVRPVLVAVGDRWKHTGNGVEVEHLMSECVAGVFGAQAADASTEPAARPVLLAGMPGEQHVLPLVVLCAVLAGRGVPCRPLGADLPVDALVAAIRRTAPSVVVLWAQLAESADGDLLHALPTTRPRFRTYVAGPGWSAVGLPPRVGRLDSLGAARRVIGGVVGPTSVPPTPIRPTGYRTS